MKLAIAIACLFVSATWAAECTREGYWGEDCNNVCGKCKDDVACNKANGQCANGCAENWTSEKSADKDCSTPTCFGDKGCSEGGKCVDVNYCICGEQGAQIVGKSVTVDGTEGIDCVSLRKDGIKGAGIAMVVMFVSIGFCGGVERMRNKNK